MRLFTLLTVFLLPSCVFSEGQNQTKIGNKLFLLIIDALPWNRVDDADVFPNLAQLRNEGAGVEYLKPVFPTVGYPNYFSLLTGLYPDEHGIIDEYMLDYRGSRSYFVKGSTRGINSSSDVEWFQDGELFWTTAQNQGRKVGVYGWTSCNHSESAVGPKPDLCYGERREDIDLKESYDMADQALGQLEEGSLDIAILFVNKLDYVGRVPGLRSKEFNHSLESVDKLIGHIRARLDNTSLSATTNLVVLSTHGLSSMLRPPLVVDTSRFSEDVKTAFTFFPGGSRVLVYPEEGTLARTFNNLFLRHKHIHVYWKWNMPLKWRIRNSHFAAPILVTADPGWAVAASKKEALYLATARGGLDGYDPDKSTDMRGVFMAVGPNFKQNHTHGPISITDLYNLLCQITGLRPSNNSGQWSRVADMLEKVPHPKPHLPPPTARPTTARPNIEPHVNETLESEHNKNETVEEDQGKNATQEIIDLLTNISSISVINKTEDEITMNGTKENTTQQEERMDLSTQIFRLLGNHSLENENETMMNTTSIREALADDGSNSAAQEALKILRNESDTARNGTVGLGNWTLDEELLPVKQIHLPRENETTTNDSRWMRMEGSGSGDDPMGSGWGDMHEMNMTEWTLPTPMEDASHLNDTGINPFNLTEPIVDSNTKDWLLTPNGTDTVHQSNATEESERGNMADAIVDLLNATEAMAGSNGTEEAVHPNVTETDFLSNMTTDSADLNTTAISPALNLTEELILPNDTESLSPSNATAIEDLAHPNVTDADISDVTDPSLNDTTTASLTGSDPSNFTESTPHPNATDSAPHFNTTEDMEMEGSGQEPMETDMTLTSSGDEPTPLNSTSRRRRSDQVRLIDSMDEPETSEISTINNTDAKLLCECKGGMCTMKMNNLCEPEPQKDVSNASSEAGSRSKLHQSTPGISVGTEEDKIKDDMRAEVEVHDWQSVLANITKAGREKRDGETQTNQTETTDQKEQGSGAKSLEPVSTTQNLNENRPDMAKNAERTTNANTNVRSQTYDLGGGFMVQNRYNRPTYNVRLDEASSIDRLINLIRSGALQSPATDSMNLATNSPGSENLPLRLNQFNVANGGRATQFIVQQPVLNFLMPEQPIQHTDAIHRLPATYKATDAKSMIAALLDTDNDNNNV